MSVGKAELLAAASVRTETFNVRGVDLTVRELTLASRQELIKVTKDDPTAAAAVLVELCLVDGDGKPMLTREECAQLPAELVEIIADHAMNLSGMKKPESSDEKNG